MMAVDEAIGLGKKQEDLVEKKEGGVMVDGFV